MSKHMSKYGTIVVRLVSLIALMWLSYQYAWHKGDITNLVGSSWRLVLFVVLIALAAALIYVNRGNPTVAILVLIVCVLLTIIFADDLTRNGLGSLWLVLGVLVVLGLIAVNVLYGLGHFDRSYQSLRRRRATTTTVVTDDDPTPDPIAPATEVQRTTA